MSDDTVLKFFKPTRENIGEYIALYKKHSEKLFGCEYSPSTILLWEPFYKQRIAIFRGSIFLMFERKGAPPIFLLPLGGDLKENILLLKDYAKKNGFPLYFLAGNNENLEEFKKHFGDKYNFEPSREDFEYIYKKSDLSDLIGKKYHQKRNHISAFSRQYNWSFEPLSKENLNEVLKTADIWAKSTEQTESLDSLISENAAMAGVLEQRDMLQILGGVIRVNGKIVAFCFGTPINDRVFNIQVEKALPEFRGAYAVINREFARFLPENFIYLNREDDMGLEGLRKAKLSYRPEFLYEKYFLSPKEDEKTEENELKGLYLSSFLEDTSEDADYLFEHLFKKAHLLTENVDGKVASMLYLIDCALKTRAGDLPFYYLYAACTDPKYRGRGLMCELLKKAKKHAEANGKKGIVLRPAEAKLFDFYGKNGYTRFFNFSFGSAGLSDLEGVVATEFSEISLSKYHREREKILPTLSDCFVSFENALFTAALDGLTVFTNGKAFLACKKENDTLVCKECLCGKGENAAFLGLLRAIMTEFSTSKATLRAPAGILDELSFMQNGCFGMISGEFPPAENGYLGFAFD